MKKQYIFGLLLLSSLSIFAQEPPRITVRAGVTSAGLRGDAISNLGTLTDLTNNFVQTTNRKGIFAGASVAVPLSETFSLAPGVAYAQKGYALKGNLALNAAKLVGVHARAELNTHYVELPLLLKANLGGFEAFAGPQVAYLAKADFKTTAGLLGINVLNKKMNVTEQFNRWDGAATAGIGYQFANGLNLSAAYDHGLSRVDAAKRMNTYNHAIKVGLGFRF